MRAPLGFRFSPPARYTWQGVSGPARDRRAPRSELRDNGHIMSRREVKDPTLLRLARAADWLQRLHVAPADEALLRRCRRWLDAAPENAEALQRMQSVWQAVGCCATHVEAVPAIPELEWLAGHVVTHDPRRRSLHARTDSGRTPLQPCLWGTTALM